MSARSAWNWGSAGRARVVVVAGLLLLALTLTGCDLSLGGATPAPSGEQHLADLQWCDQPLVSFQDDSQPSQQPLTHWSAVQSQLGFTPYLPASLPKGSCLDLAGGSIHDPIFGGHLSITWVLPKSGPISFSEAPKRGAASQTPQCAQSQQGSDATTICIAAVGDASVTIASHLSATDLQAYFSKLQPNIDWEPNQSAPAPTATSAS